MDITQKDTPLGKGANTTRQNYNSISSSVIPKRNWLDDLQLLVARFRYLGISDDIASLSIIELWGLYLFLSRLAEGGCHD